MTSISPVLSSPETSHNRPRIVHCFVGYRQDDGEILWEVTALCGVRRPNPYTSATAADQRCVVCAELEAQR